MLSCYLEGIGLIGPGIHNWAEGRAVLAGTAHPVAARTEYPVPSLLPATERRRTGLVIKLALAVGLDAIESAALDAAALATVFASSGGDNQNCHAICEVLASADRTISPTRFHNSVANAPAGYWGIATSAQAPSTVVCAHDASFVAGLLEAVTQVLATQQRCVLIAYDTDYPEPLHSVRPIPDGLGIALVLAPQQGERSMVRLECELTRDEAASRMALEALEVMRSEIPAGRGLPLLDQVARGAEGRVVLDYLQELRLAVKVVPCR